MSLIDVLRPIRFYILGGCVILIIVVGIIIFLSSSTTPTTTPTTTTTDVPVAKDIYTPSDYKEDCSFIVDANTGKKIIKCTSTTSGSIEINLIDNKQSVNLNDLNNNMQPILLSGAEDEENVRTTVHYTSTSPLSLNCSVNNVMYDCDSLVKYNNVY